MKGMAKGIIAGVVIIVIGVIMLISVGAKAGWEFDPEFEVKEVVCADDNTKIELLNTIGEIELEYYDGDKVSVSYPVSSRYSVEVIEAGGTVCIKGSHQFNWWISFGYNEIPKTVIKMPRIIVYELNLGLSAGTLKVPAGTYSKATFKISAGVFTAGDMECGDFTCKVSAGTATFGSVKAPSMDCKVSAGSLEIRRAESNTFSGKISAGDLKVKMLACPKMEFSVSAGEINATVDGKEEDYTIDTSVSAGDCNLRDRTGENGKSIEAKVSAGSLKVYFIG